MTSHRIVSLIASATEIVAALGFEEELVGRSHECDFPPSVRRLPTCSQPRIDVNGTSLQIDQRVKAAVQDALSVYSVHVDVLEELRPTHIITQTQCGVCAVSLSDVERAVCQMTGGRPQVVSLEPMSLADVWEDIRKVAAALDAPQRGDELIAGLQSRLDDLAAQAATIDQQPTVGCIEWLEPLMCAGNWVPELVEIAGGRCLFGEAGRHSPSMSWDQLREQDPDVLAVMPCGFDVERTCRELHLLTEHPFWSELQAVRNNRVFVTDGNQYFNRPGPRVVESAEILAEIQHPGRFDFGHAGSGWVNALHRDDQGYETMV